jgi:hypothetical protein
MPKQYPILTEPTQGEPLVLWHNSSTAPAHAMARTGFVLTARLSRRDYPLRLRLASTRPWRALPPPRIAPRGRLAK